MKVKSTADVFGKTLILPIVGEMTIPADGIVEVPEELGKLLVENLGYELAEATKKVAKVEVVEPSAEVIVEPAKESETDLSSLTLNELVDLAKASELPEEEYSKYIGKKNAKQNMLNYLTEKLK